MYYGASLRLDNVGITDLYKIQDIRSPEPLISWRTMGQCHIGQMMKDLSFVTSLSLLQHCLHYNNCQEHIKIYRDTRKST